MSLSLYPLIKQLGVGGFGTTHLATNTLLPTRPYCVVKQLIPSSNEPELQQLIQERFKQEAIVLENLGKGSNGMIPMLHHYFVEQDEYYLVQEYIDGQSLTDRVATDGVFTEVQVRQFLNDILPALTYIHSKSIIHRDIKPDNIMVRQSDNKPVLIDFGAVKEIMTTVMTPSAHTARSIVIGTPGFMPMEQVSGRPMFASDIYAIGLTAIYLLTGKTPGELETDPQLGTVKWETLASNVSPQLTEVLNKSIEYSPHHRYLNAQEMLQSLNTSAPEPLASTTVVSPPPNHSERTVYVPVLPPVNNNDSTPDKSQPNPILIGLIGIVVGSGLIAGGLVLGKNFASNDSSQRQTESSNSVSASKSTVTSTPTPPIDSISTPPKPPDLSPRDIISDYYQKINTRDFQGSWNALPISLQNDRSIHPDGYNSFLDWWENKVGSVQLLGTNVVSTNDNEAIVDADVQYFMRSGKGKSTSQAMRYFFIKNTSFNTWKIDKIRLR
jgi:serine/threonine protein kinase, bacterial